MRLQRDTESGFMRRASTWMIILGWVLFFALLFMLFNRILDRMHNPNSQVATGYTEGRKSIVLQRNKYGHYVASGSINGQPVVFLVDTGATDIAIPEHTAARLGLEKGYAFRAQTANGLATAYATRLETVSLGNITLHDVRGSILDNAGTDEILLGMSFLKHLELVQKGDELRIIQ